MQVKDYYRILELDPAANLTEIKNAYRRLAHQFHPDKNKQDPAADLQFAEIKEAYEILSDPGKKNYYLQQRWYQQSIGRKKFQQAFSPVSLLQQTLELERYVSKLDVHRMDRQGLFEYTIDLVPDEVIQKLNAFKDESVNKQVIQLIISAAQHLNLDQLVRLGEQVKKIEPLNFSQQQVKQIIERKRRANYWERSIPWLVLLAALLLCFIIFLANRN
jgi:curved DNA-binding protein CbpA